MKNNTNSAVAFGITLASPNRNAAGSTDFCRRVSPVHRENAMQGKTWQRPTAYVIGSTCRKTPAAVKPPFKKEIFNYKPVPHPKLPPKPMHWERPQIHEEPKHIPYRTPYSSDDSVVWEIVKFVGTGIFHVLKFTVIAFCLVLTVACFIVAGRK